MSLHPSLDRTLTIESLRPGGVMRGRLMMVEASGKGMNVAHTLSNLGHRVVALGFLSRRDSGFFLSSLDRRLVEPAFVEVESATRVNITLVESEKRRDTHVTDEPMRVTRQEVEAFLALLRCKIGPGDRVIFSGSTPRGLTRADYLQALRACRERGASVCVDTSGPMLRAALRIRPWLIKPNREELEVLSGRTLRGLPRVVDAAKPFLKRCVHVLVSLGAAGAVLVTADGAWHARETRRAKAVHSVGCGDALLSGFLSALGSGEGLDAALRFGVACGSACVRSRYACIRSQREARRFLSHVAAKRL